MTVFDVQYLKLKFGTLRFGNTLEEEQYLRYCFLVPLLKFNHMSTQLKNTPSSHEKRSIWQNFKNGNLRNNFLTSKYCT